MRCPKCDMENNDTAKFCKKCGTPLDKQAPSHENLLNSMNKPESNTTKIIIIALIVVAIVLAGALAYIYGFGNAQTDTQDVNDQNGNVESVSNNNQQADDNSVKTAQPSQSQQSQSMRILGGSFSTGSSLQDKTYASIYVGSDHAGESVQVQIWYSRDGSTLNNGNMVPVSVDSSGYIDVSSADAYNYYPDYATINIYDASGSKILDTQSVSLSPTSGTQTF